VFAFTYFDMTPESRNNPLSDNGSPTRVSAATHNGTAGNDLYSVRPGVIKGGHVIY
jgi:hypothetical protein